MTISTAAGVDVGRDWLDVAIARSSEAGAAARRHFRIANSPSAVTGLPARLRCARVERLVLESTGAPPRLPGAHTGRGRHARGRA
ncbi:MAG: hypothetical protein ABL956_11450 [Hyphomonadaceae bacterium]